MRLYPRINLCCSDTSAFSSFDVSDPSNLALSQNETYTLDTPGPDPDRQIAPHLHHTIVDPTGKYILAPDLGADLIRVFQVQRGAIEWKQLAPAVATPGSGPRHGVWVAQGTKDYFYSFNELSNTITGFRVQYKRDGLKFKKLFDIPSHGPGTTVPEGTLAAELVASVSQLSNHPVLPQCRLITSARWPVHHRLLP